LAKEDAKAIINSRTTSETVRTTIEELKSAGYKAEHITGVTFL